MRNRDCEMTRMWKDDCKLSDILTIMQVNTQMPHDKRAAHTVRSADITLKSNVHPSIDINESFVINDLRPPDDSD